MKELYNGLDEIQDKILKRENKKNKTHDIKANLNDEMQKNNHQIKVLNYNIDQFMS